MTNGKLSTFQMVMLISISRLFAFYIYLPIVSTPPANQDVWIVCLVSGILDIFVCFPMIYLASKFQNMSLLDYYKLIIGKVPSFIWGIILALFFLFNVIIAFNLISLFLGTVIMTETPYLVILLIVSIMCYYSVRKGFIVLGRVSQVIVPFVILSVVLFTLLNINNINLKNLMPIYVDSEFKELLLGSVNVSFRFYHIYFIAIFSPMLREKKAVKDVFKYSLIILTALYTIMTATCIASFGVAQCKLLNFLYYTFIRQINVFNFIERIEFIGVMGWLIGTFISISLHIFSVLTLLSQTIKTKINNRLQLIIILLIIIAISKYSPVSEADIIQQLLSYKYLPYFQGIFIFIVPSIICIIYLIRRKSIDKKVSEIRL